MLLTLFRNSVRWRNFSLGFSLKVIFRRWMFRVNGKNLILYGPWWKLSLFVMVFRLELYQFFFLFFNTLIRWRNFSLEISLKVIFRRWVFRVDGKHFILNGSRWKLSQLIMHLFLELYQLFLLFFKTLVRWRNHNLEFSESNHFIFNVFWW